MKTPVWLLMLLLVGLIFFLFFLNLVLGSVSIPFRAVWDICLWGDHENHIWTNIIWKSRQSLRWLPEQGCPSADCRCRQFSETRWQGLQC